MRTCKRLAMLAGFGLLLSGCAHHQLTYDAVHQAKTLNQIYEQQVLDNLAMFHADPNSLPFFAKPTAGGSKVTDKGSVSAAKPLNPFFTTIGLNADRTIAEDWTLEAVNDPDKLKRMRCAYQRAVGYIDETCIDCCKLEQEWNGTPDKVVTVIDAEGKAVKTDDGKLLTDPRTNKPYLTTDDMGTPLMPNGALQAAVHPNTGLCYVLSPVGDTKARTVTLPYDCYGECSINPGFFYCRDKVLIPHPCELVGHYCGTYVAVLPEGRDQFTRLVLSILDFAVNDPKPGPERKMQLVETRTYNANNLIDTIITREEPVLPTSAEGPTPPGPAASPADAAEYRRQLSEFNRAVEEAVTPGSRDMNDPRGLKYFMPPQPRPRTQNDPFNVERNRERLRRQF